MNFHIIYFLVFLSLNCPEYKTAGLCVSALCQLAGLFNLEANKHKIGLDLNERHTVTSESFDQSLYQQT